MNAASTAKTADHGTLCLTFDNLGSARAVRMGEMRRADPADAGVVTGYPRVMNLLEDLGVRATFFVEGWSVLHYPKTVEALMAKGHEIALHGWIHEDFAAQDELNVERYLTDGTAALKLIGAKPTGFRAPGGVRGNFAVPVLESLGYKYDSSVEADWKNSIETPASLDANAPHRLSNSLIALPWDWSMIDYYLYYMRENGVMAPADLTKYWIGIIDAAHEKRKTVTIICQPSVQA
jgi:peptidoglycan/xylan/chitin deacetylase (PgdA/CDA1 family)